MYLGAASREVRRARFSFSDTLKKQRIFTSFSRHVKKSANIMADINERTEEISELVAKLTPISDMAILLGVTEIELREALDDPTTPASNAYRTAKALAALQIRERDIENARTGDTTAAENVSLYYRQMLQDE